MSLELCSKYHNVSTAGSRLRSLKRMFPSHERKQQAAERWESLLYGCTLIVQWLAWPLLHSHSTDSTKLSCDRPKSRTLDPAARSVECKQLTYAHRQWKVADGPDTTPIYYSNELKTVWFPCIFIVYCLIILKQSTRQELSKQLSLICLVSKSNDYLCFKSALKKHNSRIAKFQR